MKLCSRQHLFYREGATFFYRRCVVSCCTITVEYRNGGFPVMRIMENDVQCLPFATTTFAVDVCVSLVRLVVFRDDVG